MGWNHQLDMTDGDVVGILFGGGSSITVACWCNSWRSWSKVKINMLAKWGSWWAVAFKIFLGGNKHIQIGIVVVFQTLFSFLKEKPAI